MRIRFALGVLLCVQALLGVCAIGEPMDRDEGVYAYTAQIWRSGGAPYRDVWDQKPPGIYAIHAVGQMLAGPETVLGARMISLLANLLTTLCLFRIASRWFGPAAGLVAAACSALYLGAPFIEGNQSNTEPFLTLFLTAALDVFTSKSDRAVWLATGACLGCALLFKPSGIFCLLVLGFWPAPDAARRLIPARLGMIAAGAAAAWVPFLAYTFAAGAFDDFWNQVIVYNAVDASIRLHGIDVFRLFGLTILNLAIHENLALWLGAIVGLCLPPARTKIDALLIFWFAATILGSLAGGLAYPHYFISLVPPLALIAARPFQSGRRMLWGACLTAVALVQLSVHLPDYLEPGEALSQKKYPGQVFARTGPIADAIRQRVSPGDAVWVFGSEAEILHQAGRRSATRHISFYPLSIPGADAQQRQLEAIDEVRRADPSCVVLVSVPASLFQGALPDTPLFEHIEGMPLSRFRDEYLRTGFQFVGTFANDRLHLYCRHEPP